MSRRALPGIVVLFMGSPGTADAQSLYIPDPGLDRNVADLDYVFSQRRLTLAEGFELHASFDYIDVPDTLGGESASTVATTLAYAAHERLEIGLATTFQIRPDTDWSETLVPRVTASLVEGEHYDVGLNVDAVTEFDGSASVTESRVGLPLRFVRGDWVFLTGFNSLLWNFDSERVELRANVAVGYQLSERQAIRLDTQLFSLGLRNAESGVLIADAIPLGFSYFVSTSIHQDLNITFTLPDAAEGIDFFTFSLNSLSRF